MVTHQPHAAGNHSRWVFGCSLALMMAPALAFAASSAGLPWIAAIGGSIVLTATICATTALGMPSISSRWFFGLWLALALLAAFRLANLGVFMHDIAKSEHGIQAPIRELENEQLGKPFFPTHNCFTCYVVATHLAVEGEENLYDKDRYRRAKKPTVIHEQIGESLSVDTYQYPPPFLLLPRALMAISGEFYALRGMWFGMNIAVFIVSAVAIARWVDPTRFHPIWLLTVAMCCLPSMHATLQIQNVHLLIITICMASLPAFERRHNALGGALLGFAIVSKIFPVLLLAYLFLQRRWKSVAWTCCWMLFYVGATLAVFGSQPFSAFVEHKLPALANGEAFGFASEYIAPLIKNGSIFGISFKLSKLGLLDEPERVARVAVWAYSGMLLLLILALGLRRRDWPAGDANIGTAAFDARRKLACIWVAIIVLAQLRSPFLPWAYGNLAPLILLILLLPYRPSMLRIVAVVVPVAMLSTYIPLPFGGTGYAIDLIWTLAATGCVLIATVVACWPRRGNSSFVDTAPT